ncbi:MAG: bacterial Ig-like domain-containing protein [Lachnospiraceae bacterium]|nr:bacterial Ig-like domain-containing protein [Lachnospiraceae bacterium]
MRSSKKLRLSLFTILIALFAVFAVPQKNAEAAEKKLSSVTAVYTGDTLLVGESIDLNKLTVMGLYTDGSYVKLTDYSLSTYTVKQTGLNTVTVSCDGVGTTFTVRGKQIQMLTAYTTETTVTVGEQLDREKITVRVYYSDGTNEEVSDYSLSGTVVTKIGSNEFVVTYEGKTAKLYITGKDIKLAKELMVSYFGPSVIVGNAPDREDFYVSLLYNDNTMERITAFELTPSVVQKEGQNTMVVSYGELSKEVKVEGLAKEVVSIKAEYTGLPVVIGKAVANENIKVTATFNDGSTDTVTNFTLSGSVVYKIGDNVITVFCGQAMAYITVRGVEAEIIDYSNGAEAFVRSGLYVSRIKIAVNAKADADAISVTNVESKLVRKAMHRVMKTDKYLAYEVSLEDPDLDQYLPMTVKVTVPNGFDKDNFAVFYTTNRKTIMAQMNGEFLKDGSYEFKMFQPGTYIIADCNELVHVESIELDEPEITMRVGRNYSLDPAVYPHTATNQEVTYSSSRPHIVSVDENGLLEALEPGVAVITVESTDGSGTTCKLLVYVTEGRNEFAKEFAALNERLSQVETEDDLIEFLEFIVEDSEKKYLRWGEEKFLAYYEELDIWGGMLEDYCADTTLGWDWDYVTAVLEEMGLIE